MSKKRKISDFFSAKMQPQPSTSSGQSSNSDSSSENILPPENPSTSFSENSSINFSSNDLKSVKEQDPLLENETSVPEVKKQKSLQEIGEKPNQPNIQFKKSLISGKMRNFQYKWFIEFPWLHYNESEDKAYCFLCTKCIKQNLSQKMFSKAQSFTYDGFNYWNKGPERFKMHQLSEEHKEANCKIMAQKSGPVDEILDKQYETQRTVNRNCLLKLLKMCIFVL